ncbi:MAG: rod shape-determining protein MreC [Mariprofundaceae bacterium]|nr:rod shape-determining protein MreC [Mariprofundaceae bacterium]
MLIFVYAVEKFPIGQKISLGLAQALDIIQAPVHWVDDAALWFKQRQQLQHDLLVARQTMAQRSSLEQQNQSLQEENKQLRSLLKTSNIQGYQWCAARVLGHSPEQKSRHLILETQSQQDDVVIARTGLVGLIDQSQAHTAMVRTILDGSIAVPVTLPDSSLAALVRGEGDHLSVDFIPLNQAPKVGDVLQTSGAGGLFPPGISVAYVTHIEPVAGRIFAKVTAVPTAHWQREAWLAIASLHHPMSHVNP